jgi:PleD family two-component response regulator
LSVQLLRHQALSFTTISRQAARDLALEKKNSTPMKKKASLLVQVQNSQPAYEQLSKTDALTGLANRRELERFYRLSLSVHGEIKAIIAWCWPIWINSSR